MPLTSCALGVQGTPARAACSSACSRSALLAAACSACWAAARRPCQRQASAARASRCAAATRGTQASSADSSWWCSSACRQHAHEHCCSRSDGDRHTLSRSAACRLPAVSRLRSSHAAADTWSSHASPACSSWCGWVCLRAACTGALLLQGIVGNGFETSKVHACSLSADA